MRCGVGAFWVGSRLDEWWVLLDFFFLAVEELVGAGAALDCCGLDAGEDMLATLVSDGTNVGADAGVHADAEHV
jgi:hypothetical protein